MFKTSSILGGILCATFAAGPIFLTILAAATAYATLPAAVIIDWAQLVYILPLLLLATIFGALLSFFPNLVGAFVLAMLADQHQIMRAPLVWALTGATLGALIASAVASTEALSPGGVALVATATLCALICRRRMEWPEAG